MVKVLSNQTLYQCEHCGKRLLTPHGAKLHEEQYCSRSPKLAERGYEILINCQHEWEMCYEPIPGEEHLLQPSHTECAKCSARSYLVRDRNGEVKPKTDITESELIRMARIARSRAEVFVDFDF